MKKHSEVIWRAWTLGDVLQILHAWWWVGLFMHCPSVRPCMSMCTLFSFQSVHNCTGTWCKAPHSVQHVLPQTTALYSPACSTPRLSQASICVHALTRFRRHSVITCVPVTCRTRCICVGPWACSQQAAAAGGWEERWHCSSAGCIHHGTRGVGRCPNCCAGAD